MKSFVSTREEKKYASLTERRREIPKSQEVLLRTANTGAPATEYAGQPAPVLVSHIMGR
jgi:hypothetical protein